MGNSTATLEQGITELYRHWGANGILLYVGISKSTPIRLQGHASCSPWFSEITSITIERFPTREIAIEAERRAIANERPRYNCKDNPLWWKTVLEIKSKSDDSRRQLYERLSRMADFKPVYTIQEIRDLLKVQMQFVTDAIKKNKLGTITVTRNWRGAEKESLRVTGWQLIDWIEYLERQ